MIDNKNPNPSYYFDNNNNVHFPTQLHINIIIKGLVIVQ